jgi:hypothetical protein
MCLDLGVGTILIRFTYAADGCAEAVCITDVHKHIKGEVKLSMSIL